MSACAKCGFDAAAVVLASWSFLLEREIRSLNARVSNHGATRWQYAKERDAWHWVLVAARLEHRIPVAARKRRLTLVRLYANRQREVDRDNLVGGTKPVVDACVSSGLLVDDRPAWVELHHGQEKSNARGLRILMEEIV